METLVVVDHSMVEYYKSEDVNTYIFTIMNMVSAYLHVYLGPQQIYMYNRSDVAIQKEAIQK